jgi:hypothetical protein
MDTVAPKRKGDVSENGSAKGTNKIRSYNLKLEIIKELRGEDHGEVSQLLILSLMIWSPKTSSAPHFLFSAPLHEPKNLFHHLSSYHLGAKTLLSPLVLITGLLKHFTSPLFRTTWSPETFFISMLQV